MCVAVDVLNGKMYFSFDLRLANNNEDILLLYQHKRYQILCIAALESVFHTLPKSRRASKEPQELDFMAEIKRGVFSVWFALEA